MIEKIEKILNHKFWVYCAFFSIGYGLGMIPLVGFPAFLLIFIWVVILYIDRKKL